MHAIDRTSSRPGTRSQRQVYMLGLNEMLDQVEGTFSAVTAAELLETRIIQGYTVSGLSAIYGTMAHLEQHAGQILYLTKLRLGDAYRSRPEPLGETDY